MSTGHVLKHRHFSSSDFITITTPQRKLIFMTLFTASLVPKLLSTWSSWAGLGMRLVAWWSPDLENYAPVLLQLLPASALGKEMCTKWTIWRASKFVSAQLASTAYISSSWDHMVLVLVWLRLTLYEGDDTLNLWDMSRKGGTGGSGWVHPKGTSSMAASGLGCRKHWLALGGPLLLFCKNAWA